LRRISEPLGKQSDVKAVLSRMDVDFLFGAGKQIEEQGPDARALQHSRHEYVARAVAAAPAAVREENDAGGPGRHRQVPGQGCAPRLDLDLTFVDDHDQQGL
jgi:hypothetical protein